ncbi:HalOD1 output domain-containing protein [Halorussus sp. AFM4]|uniref:HalOD1 output domain-containing protein n=1 Tax=Halorussus sp. AFM4 TaxID=3421651 RepID=UPI003EB9D2AB
MSKSGTGNDTTDSSGPTEETDRSGVYRASYDPDGPATVSDAVIEAVADVAGVDPTSTVIPLSETVDPDALDALFTGCEGDAQVAFRVCGLHVLVRSDGRLRIVDDAVCDDE